MELAFNRRRSLLGRALATYQSAQDVLNIVVESNDIEFARRYVKNYIEALKKNRLYEESFNEDLSLDELRDLVRKANSSQRILMSNLFSRVLIDMVLQEGFLNTIYDINNPFSHLISDGLLPSERYVEDTLPLSLYYEKTYGNDLYPKLTESEYKEIYFSKSTQTYKDVIDSIVLNEKIITFKNISGEELDYKMMLFTFSIVFSCMMLIYEYDLEDDVEIETVVKYLMENTEIIQIFLFNEVATSEVYDLVDAINKYVPYVIGDINEYIFGASIISLTGDVDISEILNDEYLEKYSEIVKKFLVDL